MAKQRLIEHRIELLERSKTHCARSESKLINAITLGYQKASVDRLESEIEFLKSLLKFGEGDSLTKGGEQGD